MTHSLFSKPDHTVGDLYSAVLNIHDAQAARDFYLDYVEWAKQRADRTQEAAESLAKQNIGWIFGEGMAGVDIQMWITATGSYHPVFGTMVDLTPEKAFKAGMEWKGLDKDA